MSRIRRFFGMDDGAVRRDPSSDYWYGQASAGHSIVVNARTVQTIPEVYDCLQVLAQTIAALPLIVYKRGRGGARERDFNHPIADLLHRAPNDRETAFEFRAQMTWDLCLHRNAFAEIKPGPRGPVSSLHRIDPERTWIVKTGADYVYEVREDNGQVRRLLREEVFHLRAPPLTSDCILGRSLIEDGAKTFARALALQDYAARFFENDATPSAVVEMPGKLTVESAKEFKEKWQNQFTGRNRHKVAVLDAGSKLNTIDIQNDKAQFIETYREVALQCIRLWRMQPHKVGILDKATFTNIEQQSLEHVTDTLMPWLVAWEQAISRDLIVYPQTYFAEHNVSGLLRGDIKTRYEAYRVGREWGWLSANDVRRLENMNPIDGGETYLQPLNMSPAGSFGDQRAAFEALVEREITTFLNAQRMIEGRTE